MAENNIDPEQIRQTNDALADLTETVMLADDALANLYKLQSSGTREQREHTAALKKSTQNIYEMSKSLAGASMVDRGLSKLGETSPKVAIGLETLATVTAGAVAATKQMAKSLHAGERGAAVSAKALSTFAESVTTAGQVIGAAMMLIPGVGLLKVGIRVAGAALALFSTGLKEAAQFNEIAAEQNDKLFKSFNQLSQSGLVAASGMSDVFDNLQTMKMTTAELDKFNSLLSGSATDLKMFGTTTADGAATFAKVAGGVYDGFNNTLGKLGVTADDQREHTLKYMAQQTRMGMMQKGVTDSLIKGSVTYIQELDKLAMLTGASRKEQEEAREAVLKIEELRAAMLLAQESGDKAEAAKLEKYLTLASTLQASGDTRGALGAAQYGAGKGITGADSAAFYTTYKGAIEAIDAGKGSAEVLKAAGSSAKELSINLAQAKAVGADVSALMTAPIGTLIDFATRIEQATKIMKPGESLDAALARLQKERIDTKDVKTVENVKLVEQQQKTAVYFDNILDKYNTTVGIHLNASKAMLTAAENLKALSDALAAGGASAGGGPNPLAVPGSSARAGPGGAPSVSDILKNREKQSGSSAVPGPAADGAASSRASGVPKLKAGAEKRGTSTDALYAAVNQVHNMLGDDYKYFSGLNDRSDEKSKHSTGEAFDLVLKDSAQYPAVLSKIQALPGITFAQFEKEGQVNKNGSKSTGDHIHAEVSAKVSAKYGGIASGPQTGFPAMLHGPKEAIIPLATDSILEKMATAPASTFTNSATSNTSDSMLISMLVDKFDAMINLLSNGNDIQDQLLRHSRI